VLGEPGRRARIQARRGVHVFFNNDWHGCALRDAIWFAQAAERKGLAVSRVPRLQETPVG
jgi:hypothetical protein